MTTGLTSLVWPSESKSMLPVCLSALSPMQDRCHHASPRLGYECPSRLCMRTSTTEMTAGFSPGLGSASGLGPGCTPG